MADFAFLKNPTTGKLVISAPRRSKRTNAEGKKATSVCPFCIGREADEEELYRIGGSPADANWKIRVIKNKFPFTPHHEVIIHSPDHHKNFDELPFSQVELILKTYRVRHQVNSEKGQVYLFHNRGPQAGESLPHPHTQLTVVPFGTKLDIMTLDEKIRVKDRDSLLETDHFYLSCPTTSEWPDEVWIIPKKMRQVFAETSDNEISDFAFVLTRLIQVFDMRHGHEFPFNFYIYPHSNWYLRLIPRMKTLGGFELGTAIMVNTQDPALTMGFIKEHFWKPDFEKIKKDLQADYWRSA